MNFKICKLKFKTSFHLGEREGWREGSEKFIHSDTLFSAFCHAYLLLYGQEKLENLLAKFDDGTIPFLISSAFPYWKNDYYFPVPKNQLPKEKQARQISFVAKEGFEILLEGKALEEIAGISNTIPAKEKPYLPWEIIDVPRIALSRLTNHPGEDFFHFGEVTYKDDAGLFFLIDLKNKDLQKEFEATFRLLADEGIGGDRSSGKGLMENPKFSEIDIAVPKESDGVLSLSLYYPRQKETTGLSEGYYELLERKGYIYSPYGQSLRRKSIRMFAEGSVFPQNTERKGKLVNITPQAFQEKHNVFRYGFFFTFPCQFEVKQNEN